MTRKNKTGEMENREALMELQQEEIRESLQHMKNKILDMNWNGGWSCFDGIFF